MENHFGFMDTNTVPCTSFSSGEALMTEGAGVSCCREVDSIEEAKLPGDLSGAGADIKPKSIRRAKTWSDEVENLYRFQQAGYRDEIEYKQVKHVSMVERWPETGFVKKLQRRDNTFYYYDKERECEDKEVHKVKVYAY
ncbi:meiosis expressed gene 1 protein homolog isoform X2 [Heteronotia binoei]|uniref:meiosis expressed gene 1 protein homolog isoform X2 n=1 Tax=Heteronotia binoei TaxID=13085 RepID=UPI0029302EAB|nr:meiosis expressed gene 1 protein homolog isoform X2 [Heteronotia binoei]XP_060114252.1 meiosis expressed gene 1 protein homolog isoform X2 [Heteronotia binoei]XP_060114253.1 meiosis expressed gene 1 protein homolog isoform X2 [Heteronotia binoei]